MWALCYDGARNEYWNLLDKKFGNGTVDIEKEVKLKNDFYLSQNYPNPFNPITSINYRVPNINFVANEIKQPDQITSKNSFSLNNENVVTLKIYDVLGKEVTTLVNKLQKPGEYSVKFDASNLSSGIYFYKLNLNGNYFTKKMTVIK
ncbi:MAG: hypothetical protein CR986_07265 [Ignavibacteriae bacterium]|nr:MAG: hypothetical protein CR986_07265 [Ignavibacteriota bacterium]